MKEFIRSHYKLREFLSPTRVGLIYLLAPFLIFLVGFTKPAFSIPVLILLLWMGVYFWQDSAGDQEGSSISRTEILIGGGILLIWVLLSGIGGFAFQNPDFHGRNAIFRDLVTMKWPVIYEYGNQGNYAAYGFTYYIGFWLPSALIGKWLGWEAANISLFIWSWIGVCITAVLLKKRTRLKFIHAALVLIFFSGMDFAGVLLTRIVDLNAYPDIWPPIQHLEWWAPAMQFSSFTTQLYWVFNQAIPVWISLLITMTANSRKYIFLAWALCVFLSPISAIGLLPVSIYFSLLDGDGSELQTRERTLGKAGIFIRKLAGNFRESASMPNLVGGGLVLVVSAIFFYSPSGSAPRQLRFVKVDDISFYIFFGIFEWFILWMAVWNNNKRNPLFYLAGLFLSIAPAVMLSGSDVFAKRATIPLLMLLLVWVGVTLRQSRGPHRVFLIVLLVLGALTPLYEINRSIYGTFTFYQQGPAGKPVRQPIYAQGSDKPPFPAQPELDHPGELLADEWVSLSIFNPDSIGNWIGPVNRSLFYRYIARR